MLSRANAALFLRRSRLITWLLVVMVLTLSLLLAWQNVEVKANDSAFLLATQRVVERASYFKQQWLLAKRNTPLEIDGRVLNYTNSGWIEPLDSDRQNSCIFWLEVLYPEKEILGKEPWKIVDDSTGTSYSCSYFYQQDRVFTINLIGNKFSAKVGFLAESHN